MAAETRHQRGFTLVELMITLAVIATLMIVGLPSFFEMRQRAALRGAAEETLSLWNQGRFEAAKRNAPIKFSVKEDGGAFCIGLSTDTSSTDPCDCLGSTTECDIARFPENQAEWNGVTLAGTPTLGNDTGSAVIDSKPSGLSDPTAAGAVTLNGPSGRRAYQLNLMVDRLARGVLCETVSATDKMSDYTTRRCSP